MVLRRKEPCIWTVPLEDNSIIDMVIVPGSCLGITCTGLDTEKVILTVSCGTGVIMRAKVGVCFDMQLVAEVPAEPYDVPMDKIVTEKEIITKLMK